MAKTFYTERDIEDLAAKGVKSLAVTEDMVLTDLAREKARRLGVELLKERDNRPSSAPARPYLSETPAREADKAGRSAAAPVAGGQDLEARVYSSVKARLGDQVDDALLRSIVQRVLKNVGK
jgi:hypothetical protein